MTRAELNEALLVERHTRHQRAVDNPPATVDNPEPLAALTEAQQAANRAALEASLDHVGWGWVASWQEAG